MLPGCQAVETPLAMQPHGHRSALAVNWDDVFYAGVRAGAFIQTVIITAQ
jgi:hypothetical protein